MLNLSYWNGNMKFEKGMQKIPGSGSKKGQVYKATQIRNMMLQASGERFERYLEEMDKMHGEKYVNAYHAMVKFVIPTISSVKVDDNGGSATMLELIRTVAAEHRENRINK